MARTRNSKAAATLATKINRAIDAHPKPLTAAQIDAHIERLYIVPPAHHIELTDEELDERQLTASQSEPVTLGAGLAEDAAIGSSNSITTCESLTDAIAHARGIQVTQKVSVGIYDRFQIPKHMPKARYLISTKRPTASDPTGAVGHIVYALKANGKTLPQRQVDEMAKKAHEDRQRRLRTEAAKTLHTAQKADRTSRANASFTITSNTRRLAELEILAKANPTAYTTERDRLTEEIRQARKSLTADNTRGRVRMLTRSKDGSPRIWVKDDFFGALAMAETISMSATLCTYIFKCKRGYGIISDQPPHPACKVIGRFRHGVWTPDTAYEHRNRPLLLPFAVTLTDPLAPATNVRKATVYAACEFEARERFVQQLDDADDDAFYWLDDENLTIDQLDTESPVKDLQEAHEALADYYKQLGYNSTAPISESSNDSTQRDDGTWTPPSYVNDQLGAGNFDPTKANDQGNALEGGDENAETPDEPLDDVGSSLAHLRSALEG
jgi:hypothetical protein